MRAHSWIAVSFGLAMALVAQPRVASAQFRAPAGTIYVQSNVADSPGNQILAYHRDGQGKLTPVPGSPFPAGGAGISPSLALGPYDSDQEIITNADGTLLYATNGGSDSIAAFRFLPNGALVPIPGSPFPSGGSTPVSLGLAGDKLVVINQDDDPGHPGQSAPNYTTLRIGDWGQLSPIPGAAVSVDLGATPSQAYIPYDSDSLVFGADFLGGILRSFTLSGGGRLRAVSAQPLPPDEFALSGKPPLPLGLWSHPKEPILYVGFVTISRIGVYRYNKSGALTFLRSVPDAGNGVCWIRTNRQGTRLYVSNTGDPSIGVYDIENDPSEPVQIQNLTVNTPAGGAGGYQLTLDPSERFLYSITQRNAATQTGAANALHVFSIHDDGTLTEVPTSPTLLPVPETSRPQGLLAF
jgi:hypothetical protein